MNDFFYIAFVDELEKISGKKIVPFEEWRKHFEETGRKSVEVSKPPVGTSASQRFPQVGITKRFKSIEPHPKVVTGPPPSPSAKTLPHGSLSWLGIPDKSKSLVRK